MDGWWHGEDDDSDLSRAVLPAYTKTGLCGASLLNLALILR